MSIETIDREQINALALPQRAAVALGSAQYEITLRETLANSADIIAVTNKAGRDECHAAYMVLKNTRCSITKLTDDATEDAKAFTKAVKAEASRLLKITESEESRLLVLRDEWDAKIEAEKAAKIEAERLRVAEIMARIDELRDVPLQSAGKNATWLSMTMNTLSCWVIDDTFAEFATEAEGVKRASLAKLDTMRVAAELAEAEAARLAEEKRQADERAERVRIARDAEASLQRAENERIRAANVAEADRLRAERDALEKQQAEARAEEQQRQKDAAEALAIALIAALGNEQTDQATVSQNGASSTPEFPDTRSPAADALLSTLSAVSPDAGAAIVTPATVAPVLGDPKSRRNVLLDEIDGALAVMSMDELGQVAHFIDRLQSLRKAA